MLTRIRLAWRILRGVSLDTGRPPVPRDIHDLAVAQFRQQTIDQQKVIDTLIEAFAPGATIRREAAKPRPVTPKAAVEPDEPEMPFL